MKEYKAFVSKREYVSVHLAFEVSFKTMSLHIQDSHTTSLWFRKTQRLCITFTIYIDQHPAAHIH